MNLATKAMICFSLFFLLHSTKFSFEVEKKGVLHTFYVHSILAKVTDRFELKPPQ